jgi:hypothetical protein
MSSHNRKTVPASQAQPTPQPEKWGWVMANGNRSDWSNAAFAAARNVSTMHMSAVRPVNFRLCGSVRRRISQPVLRFCLPRPGRVRG